MALSLILPADASGMLCEVPHPKTLISLPARNPTRYKDFSSRTIPVGVQFGVVRVLEDDLEFEVATFRSDGVYLDGRHPSVGSSFRRLNKTRFGGISLSMECFTIP